MAFSHTTYRIAFLNREILKPLGYPYDDINYVKRESDIIYKGYGNRTYEPDDIYFVDGIPSLVIELKPKITDFDEALQTAEAHAKNFREDGVVIPYIMAAAGERVVMYKAKPSQTGLGVLFEELPDIINWDELVENVRGIYEPPDTDTARESAVGLETFKNIFLDIMSELKSSGRPKFSNEEAVHILNEIILTHFYKKPNYLKKILDRNKVPKKYVNPIVNILNRYDLSGIEGNEIAYAYRRFVTDFYKGYSDLKHLQRTGRYLTPHEVIQFMVNISEVSEENKIIDPACGSGGFLAGVISEISEDERAQYLNNNLYGCDIDPFCVSTAKTFIELLLPGEQTTKMNIYEHNGLYCEEFENREYGKQRNLCNVINNNSFDLVISNPPGNSDYSVGFDSEFVSNKLDLQGSFGDAGAFVKRTVQLAKDGGRICLIIPESFLANFRSQDYRDNAFGVCYPKAIISLPRFIFPNVGSKMAIILLEKGVDYDPECPVFMASIEIDEENPSLEGELDKVYEDYIEFVNSN